MLSYAMLSEKLKNSGCVIRREQLVNAEEQAQELEFHPVSLHRARSGSVCVLYVSEMMNLMPVKQEALYLLLPDHSAEADYAPRCSNYIVFSPTTDNSRLCRTLQQFIDTSRKINDVTLKMTDCLFSHGSVGDMLKIAERALDGNPLFLSDTSTKVLEWSDMEMLGSLDDELIQSVFTHGYVTMEYFDKYDYTHYLRFIENSSGAFINISRYEKKRDRIICKITVDGYYFGWIVVVACRRPFTQTDCEIVDVLASFITLQLEKQQAEFSFSRRENLLIELFYHRVQDREEFVSRANAIQWNPGSEHVLVVIGLREEPQSEGRQDKAETGREILAYKNHLKLIFPHISSFTDRNHLILFAEPGEEERMLKQLPHFLSANNLVAAVSDVFKNIMELPLKHTQCIDVLRIGPQLKPGRWVYYYREYAVYHQISRLARSEHEEGCVMPEILMLSEYDKAHKTEYLPTLRCYIKTRNAVTAAELLHVHRNTMVYRLQKIREITGVDPEEEDNLYKLWFSLTAFEIDESQFRRTAAT